MNIRLSILLLATVLASSACTPPEDPQVAIAAQAAVREQAAAKIAEQFDAEFGRHNWDLARAHGDELTTTYPDTAATARIKPQYEEARAKSDAAREQRRTAALWDYASQPVKGGSQLSAAIYSKEAVDTGGGRAHHVRLIFRDHPSWGRSSYLVLENGDFNCYSGCKVKVKIDDAAPKPMAASRPKTDEAIAMFIEDERALWRIARDAKVITIEFPVKAGGTRTATYEVAGLEPSKLPKWN